MVNFCIAFFCNRIYYGEHLELLRTQNFSYLKVLILENEPSENNCLKVLEMILFVMK